MCREWGHWPGLGRPDSVCEQMGWQVVLVVLFMLLLPFNPCCLRKLDQPERKKSLKCTCGEGQKTEYLQRA